MRLKLTTSVAATLFVLLSTGGSNAATSPEAIADVLSSCPLEARVGQCANAVIDFANALPGNAERNDDLLALASALADEAAGSGITPFVCQELQLSIRLAGQAAAGAAMREEIGTIADQLCAPGIDMTATGSIGSGYGGNNDGDNGDDPFEPPLSLIDPPDDNDDAPPPVVPPIPPSDPEEDEDPIFEDG